VADAHAQDAAQQIGTDAHDAAPQAEADAGRLKTALTLILLFMAGEIAVALLSSSLALLSDAAHMLTDAAALAMALLAARLAARPAKGVMTFGLGRAEILSANANGMTLLVLALLIVYGAIRHLITPLQVQGTPVLVVALVGIVVNLAATRILGGHGHGPHAHTHEGGHAHTHEDGHAHTHEGGHAHTHDRRGDHEHGGEQAHDHQQGRRRSLNVEGSYQHLLTDLFGFVATAAAAVVIMATGFRRADAIASLLIAAVMLHAAYGLIRASVRVMMEAAPEGVDPDAIGRLLAAQPGVAEIHDLHIWEVTSGFPAISAHVIVEPGHDCHEIRRALSALLQERFALAHSTLQVEHPSPPLQIEVTAGAREPGLAP
jgi:cobalt-zinc-cadmium efflux system protein